MNQISGMLIYHLLLTNLTHTLEVNIHNQLDKELTKYRTVLRPIIEGLIYETD